MFRNEAKGGYLAVLALLLAACAGPGELRQERGISWDQKSSTPGAALAAQVVARREHAVLYEFTVRGLPANKTYALWARWLDGEQGEIPHDLMIDSSGHVVHGKNRLIVNNHRMFKGEPVEYQLISSDGKARAFTRVVPFPLKATGKGNCSLTLQLVKENGRTFVVVGEGFSPEEEIQTQSVSGSEILRAEIRASKDGRFAAYVLPGVVGKTGGSARFTAIGKACGVTLHYKWGAAMQRR